MPTLNLSKTENIFISVFEKNLWQKQINLHFVYKSNLSNCHVVRNWRSKEVLLKLVTINIRVSPPPITSSGFTIKEGICVNLSMHGKIAVKYWSGYAIRRCMTWTSETSSKATSNENVNRNPTVLYLIFLRLETHLSIYHY